jgi:Tuberculosis necrotizing toxin
VARPVDWHVLDLPGDPTPGSPVGVQGLARRLGGVGADAADAARAVRSLAGDQAVLSWVGLAGDVFRGAIDDFPDQLGKLADSYQQASSALTVWASDLDGAQAQADRALVQGRAARERLDSLGGQLSSARGSSSSAASAYGRLTAAQPGGQVPPPDPDQVRSALRNQQAAASRVSGLESQAGDATADLELAKRLAREAADLRDSAADRAKSRIHDAAQAGIKPNSFWEDFSSAVSKVWKVIVVIAKITVAVLGVVVLIIGGPLAWVVFAAALILMADALLKYANGEGSLWDVAFAALGCIPGTKGLTTLGELSVAFRAGGMLGAGAHILGAGREAIVSMATSVRALGQGASMVVRRLAAGESGAAALARGTEDIADLAGDATTIARDFRLGPDQLPTSGDVHALLGGYDQLAGRTPEQFIDEFWNAGKGSWDYPANAGFDGDRVPMTMNPGEILDRFGSAKGEYLSPLGTPFPERSLPPSSLDGRDEVLFGYHAYEVVKPFDAHVGSIAPAFGQPGGGLQVLVEHGLLGQPDKVGVQWLLDNGFLRDLTGALR